MSRRSVSRELPAIAAPVERRPQGPRRAFFPATAELPPKPLYDAATRAYNLLAALCGLLLLAPLLLTIAAAVKLTSRGPALYKGLRVGRGEVPFHIYKFRTMEVGAEQKIGKRLVQQGENHFTPIGKFLRRYRLDELAQLINVLRGDMNLVGPRPMRPIFLEDLKKTVPGYGKRFLVRPGITGKAQVRGGYYTSPRHKLFYDVLYIRHRNVAMDLQLIVLTFLRVMNKIFTTGFLFGWLLLMALVLPREVQQWMSIHVGSMSVNLIYAVPPAIALWHVLKREVIDHRLYALRTPVDRPFLAWIALTMLIVPFSRVPVQSLKGLAWYVCNGAVVFYIVVNSRLCTERRSTLVHTLVFGTALTALLSVLPPLLRGVAPTSPELLTGGTPLLLSALGIVAAPLALTRFQQAQRTHRRVLYLGIFALLILTALLAGGRAGLLCLALAVVLTLWRSRRQAALAVAAVYLAVVGVLALGGHPHYAPDAIAADLRRDVERQTQVLKHVQPARLAFGVGARGLQAHAQKDEVLRGAARGVPAKRVPLPRNAWLTLLADHGILGFLSFLGFVVGGLGLMWRAHGRIAEPGARGDLAATTAGLIGLCGLMFTADLLYRLPTLLIFFSMMGMGVGTALMHQSGPRTYYRLVHFRHKL